MPPLLDDEQVRIALARLDGWVGDARRLRRTIVAPDAQPLLAEVAATADALDHHPVVHQRDAAVTFELWTHSVGGVTERDLALAARIDDIVRAHGLSSAGGPDG